MKNLLSYLFILLIHFLYTSLETKGQNLTATLRVNNDTSVIVGRYHPLLFKLSLVNYQAYYDGVWNNSTKIQMASLDRQYKRKKLSESEYKRRKEELKASLRLTETESLGSIQSPWQTLCTLHIMPLRDSPEIIIRKIYRLLEEPFVAVMNADAYYTTFLGIDSAEIKQLDTGMYQAHIDIGGFHSSSVKFLITDERKEPDSRSARELIATAAFYQQFDSLNTAFKYANLLLKKYPDYLPAHVILSELFFSKSDFSSALRHADIAIDIYYRQNGDSAHPPDYLFALRNVARAKSEGR